MSTDPRVDRLLRQGFVALSAGRVDETSACCREALALEPKRAATHFLVGLAALQAGDRRNAFRAFGSVTQLEPAHAAAWAHLARLFAGEGQVARADAALTHAMNHATARDEPLVFDLIGTVHAQLGQHDDAGRWFGRAVDAKPGNVAFLQNLANNQVYLGDTVAAERRYREILEIEPDHPQAHWAMAGARRASDRGHIDTMMRIVARADLAPRQQSFLYYAIGKECEDLECWLEAFPAFARGAAARRQTVEYDERAEIAMFEFLETTFTPEWLVRTQARHVERGGPVPVFVVGQPRTGTTLIERILASHSQVHSAGELQQFSLAIRRLSDHRDPRRFSADLFATAARLDAAALGRTYLETTRRMQGTRRFFVDKLPQNYLCLPLILAALPAARVVHVTRDPMDACFASFKQLFADAYLHSYDQAEMARHHVRYRRLMAVWRERFGDRFINVAYEDTVQDVPATARTMLGHLGVPWEDSVTRFHESGGAVSTASAVQVREPAHDRSVGRWRRYERELAPMRRILDAAGFRSRT